MPVSISVVIPTHNRAASLRRTLDALATQTYPLEAVEVLVVADGCCDETVAMLQEYSAPFALRVLEQAGQGPAMARNHGAVHATGQLLLFLDDDIEAAPGLIEAHVHAHLSRTGQVVLGYLPPVVHGEAGLFPGELRAWWETMFDAMRRTGHRYTYCDLLSGNFSVEGTLFAHVGGFDASFRCHEDYEFGARLLSAGTEFTFNADALGYHHEMTDLDRALRRKYEEGIADVQLGRRHPQLRPTLLLTRLETFFSPPSRILRTLAFEHPVAGDTLIAQFQRCLDFLERARLRRLWRLMLDGLLGYWYWRGVAEALGTRQAFAEFLADISKGDEESDIPELDLLDGLEAVEQRLDEERPAGARIRYGRKVVGRIPPQSGAERLRGVHLRPILRRELAVPLLKALVFEPGVGESAAADHLLEVLFERKWYYRILRNRSRFAAGGAGVSWRRSGYSGR
ncbi:MAG: glycosyltransferase family 2 protein [Ardenticatenaceae bacterium]|nr:glycosyltransferase family 2 protein [Ardenticatenaceae bacterium]